MRLAPASELAVRGTLVLAERHGQGPITLGAVCEARGLPRQYLTKIFSSLAKADIITPIRGKKGGYTLSRSPSDISILEVIETIEGPIWLNLCQHEPPKCDEADCLLRPVWTELQQVIRERLAKMSLADCLGNGRKG